MLKHKYALQIMYNTANPKMFLSFCALNLLSTTTFKKAHSAGEDGMDLK